jgi:type 2 lantibiotic biosynthesis protein LanM
LLHPHEFEKERRVISSEILRKSQWSRAATLSERIASLHRHGRTAGVPTDLAFARSRLEQWKTQPPFADARECFHRRLAMDATNEAELLNLLGEECTGSQRIDVLFPWLQDLVRAFTTNFLSTSIPAGELAHFRENAGFLAVIQPAIEQAFERLLAGVHKLQKSKTYLPFNPEILPSMLGSNLGVALVAMLNRTLILELNVARLEDKLEGDSSEERFQSFLQQLSDREAALNLLCEYPVLARQIMICLDQWTAFSLEFLQALTSDWQDIRTVFSPHIDPGTLIEVRGGLGDRHREGRSVLICEFSSGFKLVYKPRSLSLDQHFQQLLLWANQRGSLNFQILKILDRGDHGWAEFVEGGSCNSLDEVQHFYERQGGHLALLFALEGSDFHFENIIAAGEHPVLIDLEGLYHPRIEATFQDPADESGATAVDYSVLRVGLLPQRIIEEVNHEVTGVDTSGIGGSGRELLPDSVPALEATGTDLMHIVRKRVAMPDRANRPYLMNAEIKVQDYGEAIVAGFVATYKLLLEHRDELLAFDSPFAQFANDQIRVLLRPTEFYALLLRESFHPDLLRDALDRDRFLDYLWITVSDSPELEKVIACERYDLLNGDIPIFTTRPSSRDLWSSTNQRFEHFFRQSGFDVVMQRLRLLNEDDLCRQVWFIRASLTSLAVDEGHATRRQRQERSLTRREVTPEELTTAAIKVGDRLNELALWEKNGACWVGVGLVNEHAWSILPLGSTLYDGLPGIILFLAYLSLVTGREEYARSARGGLSTLSRQIIRSPEMKMIGGFSGCGGVLYTLCHLSALWNQNELLDEAEKIVDNLPALIREDGKLDVIAGAAGCLAALLVLYHLRPSERVLSVAFQCGEHLIRHGQPMRQGLGWPVRAVASAPLTGFSHGAAGVAWALAELGGVSGEERFLQVALEGIAYERSLFLPEAGNWPDLRRDFSQDADAKSISCGLAWCHGAPGIALGRLKMLGRINRQDLLEEAEIALETTLKSGFGFSHCLCHGDLGNLEPILQASLILDDPRWKEELNRLAACVVESIEQDGWLCGTPNNVETPGLMTGLAGIGFELLRLAEPLRVPSVLCLAPPAERRQVGSAFPREGLAGLCNRSSRPVWSKKSSAPAESID